MRTVRLAVPVLGIIVTLLVLSPSRADLPPGDEAYARALPGWTWIDPGRTSAYATSGSAIHLWAGPRSDAWTGIDESPRLLSDAPGAVWTLETRLAGRSGGAENLAGLVVHKDARTWLLWGQLGGRSLEASGLVAGTFTGPIAVMADPFSYLRVRRAGATYAFDASVDGVHWTNGGVFRDTTGALAGARIGVMTKGWGANAAHQVEFSYVRTHAADLMPSVVQGARTELVAQQTGMGSINATEAVDVCGTDLGEMFDWNGTTFVAFGDTRGCADPPAWRSNTLAHTVDAEPADGLRFDGWLVGPDGRARELFDQDPHAITVIPTSGVAIGDTAFLYYMQVTDWRTWTCDHSSIASAGAGDPGTWMRHDAAVRWGPGKFNMVSVVADGSTLYVFGTPCGRRGSIALMRVETARVLDSSAYQYLSGFDGDRPAWSAREADAITVAGGPAGELSVVHRPALGRYLMTYLDDGKGQLVLREAPQPWGPWSAPVVLATSAEYPQLYGAFLYTGPQAGDDRILYFMMSMWGPYNTFWMRATLQTALPS
jgi:hypothetical protein